MWSIFLYIPRPCWSQQIEGSKTTEGISSIVPRTPETAVSPTSKQLFRTWSLLELKSPNLAFHVSVNYRFRTNVPHRGIVKLRKWRDSTGRHCPMIFVVDVFQLYENQNWMLHRSLEERAPLKRNLRYAWATDILKREKNAIIAICTGYWAFMLPWIAFLSSRVGLRTFYVLNYKRDAIVWCRKMIEDECNDWKVYNHHGLRFLERLKKLAMRWKEFSRFENLFENLRFWSTSLKPSPCQ